MSRDVYDTVAVGMPIAEVEEQAGQPRVIRTKGSDVQEFEYGERIRMNNHYVIENIYYFDVLNGIVVGKRMRTVRTPAYNIMYETEPNYAPSPAGNPYGSFPPQ
jgi:hypothetical protein